MNIHEKSLVNRLEEQDIVTKNCISTNKIISDQMSHDLDQVKFGNLQCVNEMYSDGCLYSHLECL
jgi:hypothetical protein